MYIERKENKIYYNTLGAGENTILLLHDIGRTSQSMQILAEMLAVKSRVIIIDLCGHGQSSLPKHTVSLKTMARDVLYLLENIYSGRCHVITEGLGGAVALEAFNMRPDFFRDYIFINTYLTPEIRKNIIGNIRPYSDKERDREFKTNFIRWIPAIRDDFFIFASRFNGMNLLTFSANRLLFIYSSTQTATTRNTFALPSFSNIKFHPINYPVRRVIEKGINELSKMAIRFLLEQKDSFAADNEKIADNSTDESPDLNDLMLF